MMTEQVFGTEALSRYSAFTQKAEDGPRCLSASGGRARLGLSEGDRVSLSLEGGALVLQLHVVPTMAKGLVIAPQASTVGLAKNKSLAGEAHGCADQKTSG